MKKILTLVISIVIVTAAKSQSYKKIHAKAIVCDTHNDVISTTIEKGYQFDSDLSGKTHSDLNRMLKGGLDVQVFSVFCDGHQKEPYKFAKREIDSLYEWIRRNPSKMMLVTTPAQLQQSVKKHKLGCVLGVEGGHMIEDNLNKLDTLYNRGVRYMTLTWNNNTSWATSAEYESGNQHHKNENADTVTQRKGLNDFGKQVVMKMNELGMMVDFSHVGYQTFWDAINTTTKPVLVSHSCVYALCPAFRNLKDDQIKAVGKNGGVIQVNFYSGFLDSTYKRKDSLFRIMHKAERDSLLKINPESYYADDFLYTKYKNEVQEMRAPFHLLFDHLDYIIKLIGVDHVGLGSDFDGINSSPQELNDITDYPLITKELIKRGYSKTDIKKILGGNFIRVFTANQVH
jgi:membrane dipeptidase